MPIFVRETLKRLVWMYDAAFLPNVKCCAVSARTHLCKFLVSVILLNFLKDEIWNTFDFSRWSRDCKLHKLFLKHSPDIKPY